MTKVDCTGGRKRGRVSCRLNSPYGWGEKEGGRAGSMRAEQTHSLEDVRVEILRYITKRQLEFGNMGGTGSPGRGWDHQNQEYRASREALSRLRSGVETEGQGCTKEKWVAKQLSHCLVNEAVFFSQSFSWDPCTPKHLSGNGNLDQWFSTGKILLPINGKYDKV